MEPSPSLAETVPAPSGVNGLTPGAQATTPTPEGGKRALVSNDILLIIGVLLTGGLAFLLVTLLKC